MKKRFFLLLLCSLLLLSACGDSGTVRVGVYRAVAPYYRTDGRLVDSESFTVAPGVGLINSVIALFNSQAEDQELQNPMDGARIIGYTLSDGHLRLNVSDGYLLLSDIDRTLTNCCAALTFCSLDGVMTVSVWCGDVSVSGALTASDFLLADTSTSK